MAQLRMASRLLRFERDDPVRASREDWLSLASLLARSAPLSQDVARRRIVARMLYSAVDALIELAREAVAARAEAGGRGAPGGARL